MVGRDEKAPATQEGALRNGGAVLSTVFLDSLEFAVVWE
jgi:hypothetical protein